MDEEAAKAEADRIEAALQKLAAEKQARELEAATPRPEWERLKEAKRKEWALPISERLKLLRQTGREAEAAALEQEASRPIDPDKPQRSNAPEPIEASRGSGVITRTARPQEPRKIAWPLWLASPRVALWEAVALVMNIEPSSLEPLRDGWMAGPGRGPFFERRSFPRPEQRDEFEKALSFAERATNAAGPIYLRVGLAVGMNKRTAEVMLSEVVAFFVSCEWPDIPAPLLALPSANLQSPTVSPAAAPIAGDVPSIEPVSKATTPPPLTTPDIADAFDGIDGQSAKQWRDKLGDVNNHQWLLPARAARAAAPKSATWWPIAFAELLLERGTEADSLNRAFLMVPKLKPWLLLWQEKRRERNAFGR